MTIQRIGSPRTPRSPLTFSGGARTFKCRGQQISYHSSPLTRQHFVDLGFNSSHFREGAHILLLDHTNYDRFSLALGMTAKGGIYPLSQRGDLEAVLNDQALLLADRSRIIVLPEEHKKIALAHEVLHDCFVGGGITPQERYGFTKELAFWYRLSLDPAKPHEHNNLVFYQQVAEACKEQYQLSSIAPEHYRGRPWLEKGFKIFASECFAYAGEYLLFPEQASFPDVPEPICQFIKFLRVIDPRAIQQRS